ncbi:MAG: biotin/lipoyl-binding protein [Candidatus Margulisiibacteriota bacterium]
MKKKRIIAAISLIVILTVSYFVWGIFYNLKNKDRISASGTIEAIEIQVSSRISGKVVSLMADEGDDVKKGEVLAKLDSQDISSQYDDARATFQFANTEYVRMDSLYRQAMTSKQQYDAAKTKLAQAQAALKAAQDRFETHRYYLLLPERFL